MIYSVQVLVSKVSRLPMRRTVSSVSTSFVWLPSPDQKRKEENPTDIYEAKTRESFRFNLTTNDDKRGSQIKSTVTDIYI